MSKDLRETALNYHRLPKPGKLTITPTKPLATQRDLALAYSPGVAFACEEIVKDANTAALYTGRANLVGVITNGTAVLGLGAIGSLASKPVMEGKAVLFKKFADIDVFDIEIDERDPQALIDTVARLEPTFGGINLEDIKAPECFIIEKALRERMKIPVFHDDQHGTAIVVAAAIISGLKVVKKDIKEVKLVTAGAGSAALACLNLLVTLGLPIENIFVTDLAGVVYEGRSSEMDPYKARYAQKTEARTLDDAITGADIFLGLSAGGVLKPEMVKKMAYSPLILALANPTPEIMPEEVKAVRPDAIIATGRSDYPNQVNNVLCFPFMFRGALDVGATEINEEMKRACVNAIAELAMAEPSDVVRAAYGDQILDFGAEYLIPKPFDPRLIVKIAPAVAKAAMDSGVATRPITDFEAYKDKLNQFVFRSGLIMKPVFERARKSSQRVVYAEGEEERVLQAVQEVIHEGLARPVLLGRPEVVEMRLKKLGLKMRPERDFDLVNIHSDARFNQYWKAYHSITERLGVSPSEARTVLRSDSTAIAAMMLKLGDVDSMICGTVGRFHQHLQHINEIIGKAPDIQDLSTMNILIMPAGTFFISDTQVSFDPSAETIAETTILCADEVRRFGIVPKVALLSHSNFGTRRDTPTATKMRRALQILNERAPTLEVEGEMHADAALSEEIRLERFPNSRLTGQANLLIMPTLDAANITFNMFKVLGGGVSIGPILIGADLPAHVVTPSITVRGLINMTAVAVARAKPRIEVPEQPVIATNMPS
ncbi:malic enzyme [Beggiatoa alba B18LD]|uniref:NADP-dependent malic enzyme n=1 Tax=Beggiatoa alba B18LD TaxID=395493 RepID=I3CE62_9GAMM|nr:NADP-dependent malic enzyme [Beggiatoa alba]EIJ41905.1 malic enzyme [Beggiatoa alba B18LD]